MAKNWEKGKKDQRRDNDRDFNSEQTKKKKLKPVEKIKYRNNKSFEMEEDL